MSGPITSLLRPRVGLALGGGAARGFAHLGVLQVLEERDLRPAAVAGTSIGAILGGLWASDPRTESMRQALVEYLRSRRFRDVQLDYLHDDPKDKSGWAERVARAVKRGVFFGRFYLKESFIPEPIYREHFVQLLPDARIESLPTPFAAMASDLISGRGVTIRTGTLRDAALASGAIPGVMPPIPYQAMVLVDGVASDRVPVRALIDMSVDVVIAIDVASDFRTILPSLRRGVAVHDRAGMTTEWNLREVRTRIADLVVWPDVTAINPLDFPAALPAIDRGRDAMIAALPKLRSAIRRAWVLRWAGQTRVARARRLTARGWLGSPPVTI
ncbi:MAG: hypothetical protein HC882_02485 [Acidobacteria bacterium]|nr:hypothetical protein [Acidobacteriota bacterium]